jgi:hypothetical protein
MGIPINPVSEFDAVFDNLREMLTQLTVASAAAKKLSAGKEKEAIISATDSAVRISEDIFRSLKEAREKLSRRFM